MKLLHDAIEPIYSPKIQVIIASRSQDPSVLLRWPPSPLKGALIHGKIAVFILLMVLIGLNATAQEVIINNTTLLIAEGKYKDAEKYLDSIISVEPKHVTALMMKGNVLLNYALMQTPAYQNITAEDESIFSKELAGLKDHVVIVPAVQAAAVEKLWKKCLTIDSSRLDIQKGLCSLYGMSLMRKQLLDYLPVIAKSSQDKGNDFAYTLVEYARLLHERGDREGSYMVYQKVIELYPRVSGLWCVLAGMYFTDNDLVRTKEYTEKGMLAQHADRTACRDALDIYTAIGEPNKVLAMLQATDKDTVFSEYPFHLGIYKYAHHDTTWRRDITAYLQQFPVAADSNPVFNAALFTVTNEFTDDYKGIMSLLNFNLNDFDTKLIAERAMHDYKDSALPYAIAIQVMINDKQYAKANELLTVFTKKYPGQNNILYYYGYSLYSIANYKAAIDTWNQYVQVVKKAKTGQPDIDAYLAAPYYFLGQSYLKTGNKAKALEYFKLIDAGQDESKYAYMAKIMLDKKGP